MTTLATQASALKKQVKKIESKEACELAILKECGGYELNKAKTGLEGNLRALNNAEADLRIILQLELEADEKLAATAGSKREKAIAASQTSLNYAKTAYEQAQARHDEVLRSAESDFMVATIKYQSKISAQRVAAERRVTSAKLSVAQSEASILRLEAKKAKHVIKAQFAKQPLVEELERVEKTSEDIRNMELAKIKELCAATKKQFVPEYYVGLPLDFLRDEIESLQMRQAYYKSDEYKEDTQHRVK
jgi:hypothetical protein